MKKRLIVLQNGSRECGSAALLSIIRYYGGNISLNKLVELTNTTTKGTNFYELKQASLEVGLYAKSYFVSDPNQLFKISVPFICQLVNNNYYHFVVVYKIDSKVLIMDPASGSRYLSIEEFQKIWTGYIMIFEPIKKLPYYEDKKILNNIILQTIINNYQIILNIFFLSIVFTILTCLYSFYFKVIIDNVINTNINNLKTITIIFIIIIIIKTITDFFRNQMLIYLNQKLDLTIFMTTIKKILLLPYSYYKNRTTGDILSRISDLSSVKSLISKIILSVFLDLITSIVGAIILYNISSKLFMITIIIIILYIVVLLIFNPLIKKLTKKNQENNALINSNLVEMITNYETIKNLALEKSSCIKIEQKYLQGLHNALLYNISSNIELLFKNIINYLGIIIIIYLGTIEVMNNNLTIGSLITYNSLLVYFLNPLRNIVDLSKEYHYSLNAVQRANDLLELDEEPLGESKKLPSPSKIHFQDANFSFNNQKTIIKDLNLTINSYEKVLIIGPSGSGKSTILKLIYKFFNLKRGELFLDEIDINDYPLSNIRNSITYISQQEFLYNDTIRNNIILNRDISEDHFLKLTSLLYIDEIVKDSFLGYDTPIEEGAGNISGGQRQRIILARALLKNSHIIMIDEGLSEMDINLERKILKNIFSVYKNCTFLIVSHRLDNMDLYDKVIKLENGQINDILSRRII